LPDDTYQTNKALILSISVEHILWLQ